MKPYLPEKTGKLKNKRLISPIIAKLKQHVILNSISATLNTMKFTKVWQCFVDINRLKSLFNTPGYIQPIESFYHFWAFIDQFQWVEADVVLWLSWGCDNVSPNDKNDRFYSPEMKRYRMILIAQIFQFKKTSSILC